MDEQVLPKEFGRRVRRRRMALGMIQKALAETTGFQSSQISRLEKGEYVSMKFAQLVTLADALETSVDYLLGRDDDPGEVPDRLKYAVVE